MLEIHKKYPKPMQSLVPPQATGVQVAFLDIETTGFHRIHNKIILIGFMVVDENEMSLIQWFDEDGKSEKEILLALMKALKTPTYLITFNGEKFDMPYIAHRMAFHGLFESPALALAHLLQCALHTDLYTWAKLMSLPTLENKRLKNLERLLGIAREDTISGKESIALYYQFLNKGDRGCKDAVLLHNADDIANMYPLWRLTEFLPEDLKALFTPQLDWPGTHMSPIIWQATGDSDSAITIEGISGTDLGHYWHEDLHMLLLDGHRFKIRLHLSTVTFEGQVMGVVDFPKLLGYFALPPQPSAWVFGVAGAWRGGVIHQRILDIISIVGPLAVQ